MSFSLPQALVLLVPLGLFLSPSAARRGGAVAERRGLLRGLSRPVDVDASDFAAVLDAAAALIPAERKGRVLVVSDE